MKKRTIKYGGAVCGTEERRALIKSIDKSIVSRNWQQGEEGALLEKECAKYLKVKYGILTNSGSSAGLLALSALELPRGSEVIIAAVTFPTIFNIILQCGLTPVVVDAKIGTYGFDVDEVEKAITPKTRAIIAIHPLGNPVDMPKLMKMVNKKNDEWWRTRPTELRSVEKPNYKKIYVIEDNCDGWGTTIDGKPVGSFGDISITSFHAAHIVSMGVGGGVFVRSDRLLAQKVRMYRDWGRQADINKSENKKWKALPKDYNPRFIYEKIGYNFQILELQCAMGRVQLRKTELIKKARKRNFDYLTKHLSRFSNLILPTPLPSSDVCWFSYPITVRGKGREGRGLLLKHLEKHGIETRPLFAGDITKHPAYTPDMYRIGPDGLKEAQTILKQSFWLSVHPSLTKSDLRYMAKVFEDFYGK